MKVKLGIFSGFQTGRDSYELYVQACEDLGVPYEVVDIISADWIDNIRRSDCTAFLARPSPRYTVWKRMFDERLYFVVHSMGKLVYPSYEALLIYENKRAMAYFLEAHEIPHPATHVFYRQEDALAFVRSAAYPLVFKTHIGASATGVRVLQDHQAAESLVRRAFRWGLVRRAGLTFKGLLSHRVPVPYYYFDREYKTVLFQQYLPDVSEWRVIRIGDYYVGHKKVRVRGFHSGSLQVEWTTPPERLLRFAKGVCDKGRFDSMSLDIFEDASGAYFVNELQAYFGVHNPSRVYADGVLGHLLYDADDDQWHFREGSIDQNGFCNLRVRHVLAMLESRGLGATRASQ
jgi:hypothetical protein